MFEDEQPLIRAEDLIFQLFQFGRDVAFTRRQRLLAGKSIRYGVRVRAADLDVIAKHLVEADFQLRDAGFLAVAGFKV